MNAYLDHYSGVRDYMKDIVVQAQEMGFVSTLYGRRRYLPELKRRKIVADLRPQHHGLRGVAGNAVFADDEQGPAGTFSPSADGLPRAQQPPPSAPGLLVQWRAHEKEVVMPDLLWPTQSAI